MDTESQEQDCAVCLQKCHHPTQLPCGHVFCFLCVKGVAIQNRKCAMCRAPIPSDYLDHPVLLESPEQLANIISNEQYQWYYEGRNGWWKYDERSNSELEVAFSASEGECTLLLAGTLYVVDFEHMVQRRCSDVTRRRRVRRDTPTLPSKGIAGIKQLLNQNVEEAKNDNEPNANADDEVRIVEHEQNSNQLISISDSDDESVEAERDHTQSNMDEVVTALSAISLQYSSENDTSMPSRDSSSEETPS